MWRAARRPPRARPTPAPHHVPVRPGAAPAPRARPSDASSPPPPFHSRPAAAGTLRASPRSALPPDPAALAAAAAPSATLGQGELEAKFRRAAGSALGPDTTDQLMNAILDIDRSTDAGMLSSLLKP